MSIMEQKWIGMAYHSLLTICLFWLTFVCSAEDRSVELRGEFIASNAIRVSVCVQQRQSTPDIQELSFALKRSTGPLRFDQIPVQVTDDRKHICQIHTLWFNPEPNDDFVTMEASYGLSNASHESTERRTRAMTLTRTTPQIPTVRMVNITWIQAGIEDNMVFIQIPGPAYDSTVPEPIAYYGGQAGRDKFVMQCVVEGTSQNNIKWYKNGKQLNLDSQDKVIRTEDPGIYWCGASTEFGTAFSHHIELRVSYVNSFPETVWTQAKPLTVTRGHGVKLLCSPLPYCYPDCTVVWKSCNREHGRYRQVHADNVRIFAPDDGSLIITKTEASDTLYYQCQLKRTKVLEESVLGFKTKLNIVDGPISNALILLHRPSPMVHTQEGKPLALYCIYDGGSANIKWFKNSELLGTSSLLQFDSVTLDDSGSYSCRASKGYDAENYDITVRVESKPVISEGRTMNTLYAVANQSIAINCTATSSPTPTIKISLANEHGVTAEQKPVAGGVAIEINKACVNNTGLVYCNASNYLGYSFAATFLRVFEPVKITVVHKVNQNTGPSSGLRYICDARTDSNKRLTIVWRRDGAVLQNQPKSGISVKKNMLEITTIEKLTGWFTCEATDGFTSDKQGFSPMTGVGQTASSKEIPETITEQGLYMVYLVAIGAGVFVLISLMIFGAILVSRRSKPQNPYAAYPRSRLSTMSDGTVTSNPNGETDPMFPPATIIENFHQDQTDHLPVKDPSLRDRVYEVYIERSLIEMNELIGKGQFGRVYLAQLKSEKGLEGRKVAVKTLKYKADETEIVECFLKEAVIMKNFTNPHVLSLIGISFEIDGSPMVVLPYMANGDLRDFIQDPERDITVLELLKLGLQVCKGMCYLSLRKYVHRDLACRNCMVAESSTVKVADFGLSRDLFSRDYYREASGKRPLPVRWMAPECHHSNVFTTQSDVWSFGVLLWELMTRGAVPYPNIENWNVSAHVVSGNILPQPNYCPNSVYKIMLDCWKTKAEERTPFAHLMHDIEDIIHSANEGQEDCQSLYMNIQRCEEVDYRSTTTV